MKHRAFVKSLGFQLVAIIMMSFLVPTLILSVFSSTVFFRSLEEKTEASLQAGAEHAAQIAMNNIDRIITLAKDVTYDGVLTSATAKYESGNNERYDDYYMEVRSYLDPKFGRESVVQFAAFYRTVAPHDLIIGRLGQSDNTAEQAAIFTRDSLAGVGLITESLDTNVFFFQNGADVYLIRNLYNMRLERFGVLVLGIDITKILSPLHQEAEKWQGEMALSLSGYREGDMGDDLSKMPSGISDAGDTVVFTQHVKGHDLTLDYVLKLNKDELYKEIIVFRQLLFLLIFMLIPILTFAMLFIRRRILKPIRTLSLTAARIEKGELGVTVPMHSKDELGQLGESFSNMSVQLKDLIETGYLKEIALRDAKIQALQSRINPHFINNALEMINWQARMEDADTISEMVEALSVLLNAAMDRDNERLVPLKQEMEIADAYFYFISLRYGDKLNIDKHVDEDVLFRLVPRMMIQTLLENAVEHGISPMGGGHIILSVFERYGRLVIEVVNNGQRLTKEDLKRISEIISSPEQHTGRLGLATTSHRLRLLYDGKALLRVSQTPRSETVFTVALPPEQSDATNATVFQ